LNFLFATKINEIINLQR